MTTRLSTLVRTISDRYGLRPTHVVSSPGRVELGGNHTDHNGGRVLSAAVDRDMLAVIAPFEEPKVIVYSAARGEKTIDIKDLSRVPEETGHSPALIRGVLHVANERGYKTGGMVLVMHSDVLPGSGLSSSAAFENLISASQSALYNDRAIEPIELAKIGQLAENEFFGKPSGLMDQLTSAVGGVMSIDFKQAEPEISAIPFALESYGYRLVIVNTKSSHANLTSAYAAITDEMRLIANAFGEDVLGAVDRDDFYRRIAELRSLGNDRAVLRAHHFFEENERVPRMLDALKEGGLDRFFDLVRASGQSSVSMLQNTRVEGEPHKQPIMLALALTEYFLGNVGAARIQGGGFAGTIQAYVPLNKVDDYIACIDRVFGEDSADAVSFRDEGVTLTTF